MRAITGAVSGQQHNNSHHVKDELKDFLPYKNKM